MISTPVLSYPLNRVPNLLRNDSFMRIFENHLLIFWSSMPFMAGVSFTPELAKVLNSKEKKAHEKID